MPHSVWWRAFAIVVAGGIAAGALVAVGLSTDAGDGSLGNTTASGIAGPTTPPAVAEPPSTAADPDTLVTAAPDASPPPTPTDLPPTSPTATEPPPTLPQHPVSVATFAFTDTSRRTAAHGGSPSVASRRLPTTVWYPSGSGSYPLVVFAPGFANTAADYRDLLAEIAARGFVVAAPEFPLTSPVSTNAMVESDLINEPADLSFVATQVQQSGRQRSSPLAGRVASGPFAVMGHSDGAVAAAAAAFNTCCIDHRIGAAVTLSGNTTGFNPTWFPAGSPALLAVHGTADTTNSFGNSQAMFGRARSPKFLLSVLGGTHEGPFVRDTSRPEISVVIAEFLRAMLQRDQRALDRMTTDGNVDGVLALQSG